MRPIVAIYSTFLQRAYDNIIHDIAVQRLPVIFCMDRAGLVGEDGQTHMGLYDIAYMLAVPGMTVTAPKDGDELAGLLKTALIHDGGPFCTRYPRIRSSEPRRAEVSRFLTDPRSSAAARTSRSSRWAPCAPALAAAESLAAEGLDCGVVNCRFLKPLDAGCLGMLSQEYRTFVTVEEGTVVNGFGSYLAEVMQTTYPEVRIIALGVPDKLIEQAPRAEQLETFGLTPQGIARRIRTLSSEESIAAR